jgi:hypothetical protein
VSFAVQHVGEAWWWYEDRPRQPCVALEEVNSPLRRGSASKAVGRWAVGGREWFAGCETGFV